MHVGGDVSLITPQLVLKENYQFEDMTLEKGRLLIPLRSKCNEKVQGFIPCGGGGGGGADPDTDQLPAWCREYGLDDVIRVESNQLQFKQGQGVMSTLSNHDWTSIPTGKVADGDFIYVRGIYLEVKAFATDFNSVMYTKNVQKNINKQKFSIGKMLKDESLILILLAV